MRVRIEVGEPRNFAAGGNANVIEGDLVESLCGSKSMVKEPNIIAMIQTHKGEEPKRETVTDYWLVVNCPKVEFEDMSFSSLFLTPRYRLKKPPIEILNADEPLVVNGYWRADGKVWDEGSVAASQDGAIEVSGQIVGNVTRVK
ncbi:MAG: hypothetical protein HY886_10140 [Deltaproteobacteria bacterium]|nr:hypothetical protein [Deltaproteobacteria bacterium]